MKKIFLTVKSKSEIPLSVIRKASEKLPEDISICYSVQFEEYAEKIKEMLEKRHNIISFKQVLGCSNLLFPKKTKAILLISNGKFHAVSLAFESKLPVFLIDNSNFEEISQEEISKKEIKEKTAYINYLNSEEAGIIITIKPGQSKFEKAIKFKKKSKKRNYLFLCNNINSSEFDNFGLKSWVNTACPRIDFDDNRVININRLIKHSQ